MILDAHWTTVSASHHRLSGTHIRALDVTQHRTGWWVTPASAPSNEPVGLPSLDEAKRYAEHMAAQPVATLLSVVLEPDSRAEDPSTWQFAGFRWNTDATGPTVTTSAGVVARVTRSATGLTWNAEICLDEAFQRLGFRREQRAMEMVRGRN